MVSLGATWWWVFSSHWVCSCQGVTDLIVHPGLINLDFADLCTVRPPTALSPWSTMTDRRRVHLYLVRVVWSLLYGLCAVWSLCGMVS